MDKKKNTITLHRSKELEKELRTDIRHAKEIMQENYVSAKITALEVMKGENNRK